jgi:hypothetical protein
MPVIQKEVLKENAKIENNKRLPMVTSNYDILNSCTIKNKMLKLLGHRLFMSCYINKFVILHYLKDLQVSIYYW